MPVCVFGWCQIPRFLWESLGFNPSSKHPTRVLKCHPILEYTNKTSTENDKYLPSARRKGHFFIIKEVKWGLGLKGEKAQAGTNPGQISQGSSDPHEAENLRWLEKIMQLPQKRCQGGRGVSHDLSEVGKPSHCIQVVE